MLRLEDSDVLRAHSTRIPTERCQWHHWSSFYAVPPDGATGCLTRCSRCLLTIDNRFPAGKVQMIPMWHGPWVLICGDGSLSNPPRLPQALRSSTPSFAMIGSKFAFAASTLLIASAAITSAHEGHEHSGSSDEHSAAVGSGGECSADVSEAFIAKIDNSTYFDTCAEGTTFNITSVFDILNFTDADFLTFCSSSTCLQPLHELMGSVDCNITYQGTSRDLAEEITELHHECHEVLEKNGSTMDMSMSGMDMTGHTHSSGSTASGSSDASSLAMAAGSLVSAAILAAFLA
ncbi:unnamed protein product [Phytophthora lilii]|uniref:Unnamed protein product n=1 Tax=Phytophthora lilii TaxID=2077276 RepID=A0A9W6WVL2_9STRA|nr:unnamed protein product [Phytophthora lilii]